MKLSGLGEDALIRRLCGALAMRPDVRTGPGDDCAVVCLPGAADDLLLTSDPVIEGTHFLPGDAPCRVGHKAAARALSDIAAMGGSPAWLLVNAVARPDTPAEWFDEAYAGIRALCERHGCAVVGGDCARGHAVELHVFAVGTVPADTAVLRSTARAGDRVFVTGALGGSRHGRHLDISPRLAEGAWLRTRGYASAMMDLSDGLAADLPRLCTASAVGARIEAARIPIHPDTRADGTSPDDSLRHALADGEDFELLVCVSAERAPALAAEWPNAFGVSLTDIGVVTPAAGLHLSTTAGVRPWPSPDFAHFQPAVLS